MKRRSATNSGAPWSDRSKCPVCGRDLIERRKRKDDSRFIGCTGFPNFCRYTRQWTRANWKEEPKLRAEWMVAEEARAARFKKADDIHCPRCEVGLLGIQSLDGDHFVGCDQPHCDYREDYGKTKST